MELAIKKTNYIKVAIIIAICSLIPFTVVLASAIMSQLTMGMNGVNNAQLTLGMEAFDDSTRLMDSDYHPLILNPSSALGQMAIETVLIFLAFSILLIFYELETRKKPLVILFTIALIIYTAFALLPAINDILRSLFGY